MGAGGLFCIGIREGVGGADLLGANPYCNLYLRISFRVLKKVCNWLNGSTKLCFVFYHNISFVHFSWGVLFVAFWCVILLWC